MIEWVRVNTEQTWSSAIGEYPKLVSAVRLVDLDAGTSFPEMIIPGSLIRINPQESLVRREDVDALGQRVRQGGPGLAELLLAEGRHFLWRQDRLGPIGPSCLRRWHAS